MDADHDSVSDSVQAGGWWSQAGSNRRPPACKAGALPAELWPHIHGDPALQCSVEATERLVGLGRFELPTSPLSGVRSNQLSYRPGDRARHPHATVLLAVGCITQHQASGQTDSADARTHGHEISLAGHPDRAGKLFNAGDL